MVIVTGSANKNGMVRIRSGIRSLDVPAAAVREIDVGKHLLADVANVALNDEGLHIVLRSGRSIVLITERRCPKDPLPGESLSDSWVRFFVAQRFFYSKRDAEVKVENVGSLDGQPCARGRRTRSPVQGRQGQRGW